MGGCAVGSRSSLEFGLLLLFELELELGLVEPVAGLGLLLLPGLPPSALPPPALPPLVPLPPSPELVSVPVVVLVPAATDGATEEAAEG